MSKRSTIGTATLGLSVAFTAALLAACGSNDSATTSGAAKPTDLATLDVNDERSVAILAKEYGIEVQPFVTPPEHRGGDDGTVAYLMFPSGKVRKEGLRQYRIDVGELYHGDGTLQFRQGRKVLWKGETAFSPSRVVTVSNVPQSVVDAVKAGDEVTWGIFFEDKRKPIATTFQVIDKPQVAKSIAEMSGDKKFKKQPVVLQELVKAQLFQNYGLFSEALQGFLDIASRNADFAQAHQGIVTALVRLDLKDSTLYKNEIGKVIAVKGPGSPQRVGDGGQPVAGTAGGKPLDKPQNDPAKKPGDTSGVNFNKKGPVGSSGGDTAKTPDPTAATSPTGPDMPPQDPTAPPKDPTAAAQATANAQSQVDLANADAQHAADAAKAAAAALDDAHKAADAANQALEAAKADLATDPSDPAKQEALAKAQAAQTAANDALAQAQALAAQAAQHAADAQKKADDAAKLLASLQQPGQTPGGQVPTDVAMHTNDLVKFANDSVAGVDALLAKLPDADKALAAALAVVAQDQAAFDAAKADFDGDPSDAGKKAAFEAAQQALMAAKAAADAALQAVGSQPDAAGLAHALAALDSAKKDLKAAQASPSANTPQGVAVIGEAARKVAEAAKLVQGILSK